MRRFLTSMSVLLLLTATFCGCSYQRQMHLPDPQLPEEIYAAPQMAAKHRWRVAVFPFQEPDYAPRSGVTAAQLLSRELLRRGIFMQLTQEAAPLDQSLASLVRLAQRRDYDAIVIGRIEYLLDGSHYETTEVTQQLQVFAVAGGEPQLLWHARACEKVAPLPLADLYVLTGKGAPAPSARLMMQRNAAKFAALLQWFPRIPSAVATPTG